MRFHHFQLGLFWLLLAAIPASVSPARADLIKLNNGGEVRGSISRAPGTLDADQITVHTLLGGAVTVGQDHFQFVTRRPLIVEEYETLARSAPDTVDAHQQLADWCRQNRLKDRRTKHLERILELDPDDEDAHLALRHVKYNGNWMTRDEMMAEQGFFKYKGRYVSRQELELIQEYRAEREAELAWFPDVKLWHGWLTGSDSQRQAVAIEHLRGITSPDAVKALFQFLGDDPHQFVRMLFVGILARIPGEKSLAALVVQSLQDADEAVRRQALESLTPQQYPDAANRYAAELQNASNDIVRRAAAALEVVGNQKSIPALIEALVTKHRYKVRVADTSSTYAFSTDGSYIGSGTPTYLPPDIEVMLRTGQLPYGVSVYVPEHPIPTRVVTVSREQQNSEVLAALRKITEQDFGYDVRSWRLWWASKKLNTSPDSAGP